MSSLARSLLFTIAAALVAPSLRAEPIEPVRLAYDAPEGCPSRSDLEQILAEKLGEAAMARPDVLARRLEIRIEAVEAGFHARLELVDRAGQRVSREVTTPTCEQSAEAIALMAALAARAQRADERLPEPPARSASPVRPAPVKLDVPLPAIAPPAPAEPNPARSEIALSLSVASGVGPGLAPGMGLTARHRLGRSGPALFGGGFVHDSFRRETDVASARFRRIVGRIGLCPIEPELAPSVALSPCASFELGTHWGRAYADGERVSRGRSDSLLFAQALLGLGIRVSFEPVVVELAPEIGLPFTESEFALRPDVPVYRSPSFTVAGRAAIGLIF